MCVCMRVCMHMHLCVCMRVCICDCGHVCVGWSVHTLCAVWSLSMVVCVHCVGWSLCRVVCVHCVEGSLCREVCVHCVCWIKRDTLHPSPACLATALDLWSALCPFLLAVQSVALADEWLYNTHTHGGTMNIFTKHTHARTHAHTHTHMNCLWMALQHTHRCCCGSMRGNTMDRNRTHKQRKGERDSDLIIESLGEREGGGRERGWEAVERERERERERGDRQTDRERGDRQTQAEMDKVAIHLGKSPTRVKKKKFKGWFNSTNKKVHNKPWIQHPHLLLFPLAAIMKKDWLNYLMTPNNNTTNK